MKTYRVYAEERVVRFKDFEAESREGALKKAELENPATWEITGDYHCSLMEVESDEDD